VESALSRHKEAEAALLQALVINEQLLVDFPATIAHHEEWATHQSWLGWVLSNAGRRAEAEACYRQIFTRLEKQAADFPNTPAFRTTLAYSFNSLGALLHEAQDPKGAEAAFRQSLALAEKLVRDFPTHGNHHRILGYGWVNLATLLRERKQLADAEAVCREVLPLYEKLAPDYPDYRSDLANCQRNLGILLRESNRLPDAEAVLRRAIDLNRKWLAEVSTDSAERATPPLGGPRIRQANNLRGQLSTLYWKLVDVLTQQRQDAKAAEAAALLAQLRPDSASDLTQAAKVYARCAALAGQAMQRPEAERQALIQAYTAEAGKLLQAAVDANLDAPFHQNNVAWNLIIIPLPQLRDPARALELAKRATTGNPKAWHNWNTLALAQYRMGDYAAARTALDRSMELHNEDDATDWFRLAPSAGQASGPDKTRKGGDPSDWFILAMVEWQSGNRDQARSWYTKAVTSLQGRLPLNEDLSDLRAEAAALLGIKE
jgi:tetratricopeptide (TPR) repeat protein